MKTLTQDDEDRLQAIADQLEQIAVELRNRARRGRDFGTLADFPERISRMAAEVAERS